VVDTKADAMLDAAHPRHDQAHAGSLAQRQPLNLTSAYDAFLFAPIGDERAGVRLTVLSALARLNLDPWEHAAHLSTLARPEAERALASTLLLLPSYGSMALDTKVLATGLVALLPNAHPAPTATAKQATDTAADNRGRNLRINFWLAWLCFEIVLTVLAPHFRNATASAADAPPPASSVATFAKGGATVQPPAVASEHVRPEDPDIPTGPPPVQPLR
jgi:hypothetical protein